MPDVWLDRLHPGAVLDVLAVALVVYFVFDWLGKTPYRRLVLRLLPLVGVLVVARAARMRLTLHLHLMQVVLAVGASVALASGVHGVRHLRLPSARRSLSPSSVYASRGAP